MSETPSVDGERTSVTLIGAAKNRDPDAWQSLVTIYGPTVFGWCKRSGLSDDLAADIVQDVWASIGQKLDQFRKIPNQGSFRGWLWTITRNKIHDWFRKHGESAVAEGGTNAHLRFQHVPEQEPDDFSRDSAPGQLQRVLQRVRPDFEETTWQAFWQLVAEGKAARDVATTLGMTPNAVHQARFRVLKRLRQELTALGIVDDPSFASVFPRA